MNYFALIVVLIILFLLIKIVHNKTTADALPNEFHILVKKKNGKIRVLHGPCKYNFFPNMYNLAIMPSNAISAKNVDLKIVDKNDKIISINYEISFKIINPIIIMTRISKPNKNEIILHINSIFKDVCKNYEFNNEKSSAMLVDELSKNLLNEGLQLLDINLID